LWKRHTRRPENQKNHEKERKLGSERVDRITSPKRSNNHNRLSKKFCGETGKRTEQRLVFRNKGGIANQVEKKVGKEILV